MFVFFFCFRQKTAYEMRISDWSSDVCSSDLVPVVLPEAIVAELLATPGVELCIDIARREVVLPDGRRQAFALDDFARVCLLEGVDQQIGRASCRERVCQYV